MFDPTELNQRLSQLAPGRSLALIREARLEFSEDELAKLSSDQKKTWSSLREPQRRLEWSEGRRCEWEFRAKLGAKVKTSISHTRENGTPVIFAAAAESVNGLGIDVELASRTLTEAVALKFIRPEEASLQLNPLQIWVIKEALFKSNPENTGTVVSHYRITSYDQGSGCAQIGSREFRFTLSEFSGWVVSLAVC